MSWYYPHQEKRLSIALKNVKKEREHLYKIFHESFAENTIAKHSSVSLAAVVAKPDEKWGETPCAFVELIKDKPATEKEIIDFCRETLAGFKLPKKVVFCDLPKTSTGKIQKFELRKKAKELN